MGKSNNLKTIYNDLQIVKISYTYYKLPVVILFAKNISTFSKVVDEQKSAKIVRLNSINKDWKGFRFTKCSRKRVPQFCSTTAKTFFLDIQFWVAVTALRWRIP